MDVELNDYKIIAKDRKYSSNFAVALEKLDKEDMVVSYGVTSRQNKIIEITDFVERTFDPHIKRYIMENKGDTHFDLALKFLKKYYPDDYISKTDFHYIMKRYGIRYYYMFYQGFGKCIPYLIAVMYAAMLIALGIESAIHSDNVIETFIIGGLAIAIITAIMTMLTSVVLYYLYVLYEKAAFYFSHR